MALSCTIYDKEFWREGFINDAESVEVTPTHNDVGIAKLTLPLDHPKAAMLVELATTGSARAVFEEDGEHRLSGPLEFIEASGPSNEGLITFTFDDDFRELRNILGWPVPGAGIGAQTSEFYTLTAPAETVVKTLVQLNGVARLGKPITIAPDLGRGETITVSLRFHPLYDKLVPVIDKAGIGVSIKQSGAGLLLDCYEPTTYPLDLSEQAGIVTGFKWTYRRETATDVIVGGKGEAVEREFFKSSDPARIDKLGERIEVFRDARDNQGETYPEREVVYIERVNETLSETQALPGVALTLSETSNFRYGGDRFNVGDRVRVKLGTGLVVEDILRSALIRQSSADGFTTVPMVGENKTVEQIIAGGLKSLARGLRDLRSR
jgi:hypothetical protein